ncbi:MAG: hypothetical protein IT371_00355 [Deltaproteobacteria bacterium]|nr:hypothetical protein [Deltaproteobacteria bacterium]
MRTTTALALSVFLAACNAGPGDPSSSVCQQAAEHVSTCRGTTVPAASAEPCDASRATVAQGVVDKSCAAIAAEAKADGPWCLPALAWLGLCKKNEPPAPTSDFCVARFVHDPYAVNLWMEVDCGAGRVLTTTPVRPSIFAGDEGYAENVRTQVQQLDEIMADKGYTNVGAFPFFGIGADQLYQRKDLVKNPRSRYCLALDTTVRPMSIGEETRQEYRFICDGGAKMTMSGSERMFYDYLAAEGYSKAATFSKPLDLDNLTLTKLVFTAPPAVK